MSNRKLSPVSRQHTTLPAAQPVAPQTGAAHGFYTGGLQRLPLIQRAPAKGGKTAAPATLDRVGFEKIMKAEFGVQTIKTGDQATQEGVAGQTITGWNSWAPDAAAGEYQQIVDAFRDFRKAFTTTPMVTDIVFYEKRYIVVNGTVVPDTDTGAAFGTTDLTIYKTGSHMYKALPLDKSNAQGSYGNAPPGSLGVTYKGDPKSAPLIAPIAWGDNFKRVIAHELGHGLQSAAMNVSNAPDPDMQKDYNKAVGWTVAVPPKLFDITVKAVQTAIAGGTTPPSQYEITLANWNDPVWGEQPVSAYSLDNPGDDFADSVMAFVYNPQMLKKRSPARYSFIDSRRSKWLPGMFSAPKQPGKKP